MIFSFSIKHWMNKETDENLNCPEDKVIKICAVLLFGVVLSFAQGPWKSSLSSKQTALLKLCSDGTEAANKPEHGWTPEQRRRRFQARYAHWWILHLSRRDIEIKMSPAARPHMPKVQLTTKIFYFQRAPDRFGQIICCFQMRLVQETLQKVLASGSIDWAGNYCYNQSPSQKHALSPLHCTPIIFVLDHIPKSLSPRCLNPI